MKIGEGTVIFVTGGASGLGKAAVLYLHGKGCTLAVVDVDVEGLKKLQAELKTRITVM